MNMEPHLNRDPSSHRPVLNLFDPVLRNDPYPHYARLRSAAPVGKVSGLEIWYFVRYMDCITALRDRRAGNDTRKSEVYRRLSESTGLRLPPDVRRERSF